MCKQYKPKSLLCKQLKKRHEFFTFLFSSQLIWNLTTAFKNNNKSKSYVIVLLLINVINCFCVI